GFAFYNTSQYDWKKLTDDAPNLAANLRNWIAGFSPNMREVIEKFDFDNTISKLAEADLLFQVVERFGTVDLHPDAVSNHEMGTIFEELIRRFNEALDENPGEHFTPRDVIRLMVELMLAGDEESLRRPGAVVTVYDPCCGSGGMLTIAKELILGDEDRPGLNPEAQVYLFGQEVNPETWAVSRSDMYMKDPTGRDADQIAFGSVLADPAHRGRHFDYVIANPPYGKDWKRDRKKVEDEAARGDAGRFVAGTPRISDGQLLFLQHMLSHRRPAAEGGSRIAIIMNGSPLFTGDAGSGESEIRRWILENDWLETLVALPEQLFYNTGIATYIWILTNRKAEERRGQVQLIDATAFWTPMRKSLGDKRREIPEDRIAEVLALREAFADTKQSKVYPTTHFGYRKITVERPLRLNFQASEDRIARLADERAFQNLATSKKKNREARTAEEAQGRDHQAAIQSLLAGLGDDLLQDREAFLERLTKAAKTAGVKLPAPLRKAILNALSDRDDTAPPCTDKDGHPEPDPTLRDTETVPLGEPVATYFTREVRPYVEDAWIDGSRRDPKDGEVGIVGYEINFNRYFYEYVPPRPLEEIEAEIREVEREIVEFLSRGRTV
ncbi:MAG: class I SAM-dependent DNA methyltransferase, partial [Thermoanaerobaculia bacterium]|nr:class I SAM-dependent DNA methyltransferase [Thermoanaerobaculia bacterium]